MSWSLGIWIGISILFAYLAHLNSKLNELKRQQETIISKLEGLREYLYEIDPQFDDERQSNSDLDDEHNFFAPMDDLRLLEKKNAEGKRTLNTPF